MEEAPLPNIPADNLAYPVRIELPASKGSGFLLNDGQVLWLVTARHVLFRSGLELYPGNATVTILAENLTDKLVLELDCPQLLQENHLRKHNNADVAVVSIGPLDAETFILRPGITRIGGAVPNHTRIIGLDIQFALNSAAVGVSNDIYHFGYSSSLGKDQLDPAYPLLRKGIVAGKTPAGVIVIDCPTYFGNSGGLVVQHEVVGMQHQVRGIGIATEMVPFVEELWSKQYKVQTGVRYENSGYSLVEPMDRVRELLV